MNNNFPFGDRGFPSKKDTTTNSFSVKPNPFSPKGDPFANSRPRNSFTSNWGNVNSQYNHRMNTNTIGGGNQDGRKRKFNNYNRGNNDVACTGH